jgi:tRNA dimethylallyltransferase
MAVLSQAPNDKEKKEVRHHLVGELSPTKEYSAAAFIKKANGRIRSMIRRRKIPIVVGGSGLYVKALVDGLFPSPKADSKFRDRMYRAVSAHGSAKLHENLARIDPEAARRIHPNDARRIIRALEIYHATGRTKTELKPQTEGLGRRYDIRIFALTRPRQELYSDIGSRIERMFKLGVIEEVEKLRNRRLSKTAGAVLGYKEIVGYLEGRYGLDAAKSLMKMNTRHFAKQQLTWFRADRRAEWFDVSKMGENRVLQAIYNNVKCQSTNDN